MTYTINIQIDDEFVDLVEQATLRQVVETALASCHEPAGMLSLVITDDVTIQQLNRDYRGIDTPTDVLSFANQDAPPTDLALFTLSHEGLDDSAEEDQYGEEADEDNDDYDDDDDEGNEEEGVLTHVLPPELVDELTLYLGDIIIAYPYAARQAADYQNSVMAELRLLAVHGTLHLLGYDHESTEEEATMWALQRQILTSFGDAALATRVYHADQFHE